MLENFGSYQGLLLYGPAILLMTLGTWLALRSGIDGKLGKAWVRRLSENLSRLLVRVIACLVGMIVLLQMVGYRLALGW
ncbi:hypothetical protein BH23PLA1_BH23PLA1_45150 [soil metagenome]